MNPSMHPGTPPPGGQGWYETVTFWVALLGLPAALLAVALADWKAGLMLFLAGLWSL